MRRDMSMSPSIMAGVSVAPRRRMLHEHHRWRAMVRRGEGLLACREHSLGSAVSGRVLRALGTISTKVRAPGRRLFAPTRTHAHHAAPSPATTHFRSNPASLVRKQSPPQPPKPPPRSTTGLTGLRRSWSSSRPSLLETADVGGGSGSKSDGRGRQRSQVPRPAGLAVPPPRRAGLGPSPLRRPPPWSPSP